MSRNSPEPQNMADETTPPRAESAASNAADQRSIDVVLQHYKDNGQNDRREDERNQLPGKDNAKKNTLDNAVTGGALSGTENGDFQNMRSLLKKANSAKGEPLPGLALDGSMATDDIARPRPGRRSSPVMRAAGLPEGGISDGNVVPPSPGVFRTNDRGPFKQEAGDPPKPNRPVWDDDFNPNPGQDNPQPKPGDRPQPKPGDQPQPKPGDQPQPKPSDQPQPKPGDQPQPKPGDQPQPKPGDQPQPKPGEQPQPKPGEQPQPKPGDQPQPKPSDQPQPGADVPTPPVKPQPPGDVPVAPPPPEIPSFDPDAPLPPKPTPDAPKPTPDAPPAPDAPLNPKNFVNDVSYPNGNTRSFVRDETGQVNNIVTKDKGGNQISQYVKDNNQWYFQTPEGMRAKIDGKIQVNPQGDVSFSTGDNAWRTEKSDGTIAWEKQNSDGSRVALTKEGKPEKITRPDGSSVEAKYTDGKISQVTETDNTGKSTVWQSNGDVFQTNPPGAEQRKAVELNANGTFSYDSSDGFRYNWTGDGSKIVDDLGLTTKKDAQGRVQEITYPGGTKVRTFGRDEQGNVNSITTKDEKGERTYVKDGNKWFLDIDGMRLAVPGSMQVSAKGDVSFETKPGVWRTEKTNGSIVTEKANDNGSRVAFTPEGKLEKIVRKDGSMVEAQYNKEGQMAQVTEYSADGGNKTTWVKKGEIWESHPAGQQRKNIDLLPNGITASQGLDGSRTVTLGDGNSLREGPGTAKFAFDKQGRFDSITYPDGEQLRFKYDGKNQLSELQQIKDGNVVKTETRVGDGDQWKVTGKDNKDLGTFNGEVKVTSSGEVRHKDKSDKNPDGFWSVVKPDGSAFQEKINSDGSRVVKNNDKSIVDIDKDGLVRKVTTKDAYRTFDYENGQLTKVSDFQKGKQVGTWEAKPGDPERSNVNVRETGELTYRRNDGKAVIEKSDQTKIELDQQGFITKVTQPNGNSREFSYETKNGQQELSAITDRRKSGDKERVETWTRKTDGSNTFVNTGSDGSTRARSDVVVGRDGDYQYKTTDGRIQIAKAGRDVSESGFSATVEEARDRLREQMESHMDEPRRKRFEAICDKFEKRAKERVEAQTAGGMDATKAQEEWDQKMARTYDHLSHMLTTEAQGSPYDLQTRAKLVENAAFAMAYPAKANDQGNWGCCWQISGVYLGVIQHPDKMAKMLDELSTSGKFTDQNGKTWTPPGELLRFTDQGSNWTIENCGNGRRSPVSEIWTSVAAYLSQDGRRMDRGARGGSMQGCMHSMKMITGETWRGTNQSQMASEQYKKDLLLKGGVILFSPGHMYLGTLEKNNGEWQAVSSVQHGDRGRIVNAIISNLRNWAVNRRHDQYKPELPNIPGVTDKPVGPNGPNRPDRPDNPRPGPRWPRHYEPVYYPQR